MELWLKVTADEYELPMAVADSCPELAMEKCQKETKVNLVECLEQEGKR